MMKHLSVLAIPCFISTVYALLSGSAVDDGEHPYMASVRSPLHHCGGAIIAPRWILTAANCLEGYKAEEIEVVVGTILRNCLSSGVKVQAEKLISHERFKRKSLSNDIGMILLKGRLVFNNFISSIGIPYQNVSTGATVTFLGWGALRYKGRFPNALKKVDLKVYNYSACWHAVNTAEHPICTHTNRSFGGCDRDQGGPLVVKIGNLYQIVGVYSRGFSPCGSGLPDVFTQVKEYQNWILDQIYNH